MKKIWIIILLEMFCSLTFCQNLVPNWSFEDTIACPTGGSQIDKAIGWISYRNSPDYFNSCNTSFENVPSNFAGFQNAKSGNAYAGIISYYTPASNLREYIGTQLIQTLIIGQQYFVSFYVALAFSMQVRFGIGINKIGIRVSTGAFSSSSPIQVDNYSQVYTDSIITDTLNWTKIKGSFIADSAYNYFSIGNFFSDTLTSSIFLDSSALYSYYYIDDIRLSPDSSFVNSINEFNTIKSLDIFPNPAHDWIQINENFIISLIVNDVTGRIVFIANSFSQYPPRINISFLPKGLYFLKIITNKKTITRKLIIIK